MRRILSILALAVALCAQTQIVTVTDIAGDSATHQVSASGVVRWVQFVAPSTNSGTVRVGDSNVTSTRGTPLAAGGGMMYPVLPSQQPGYALSQIYYFVATGDKLSISWAK